MRWVAPTLLTWLTGDRASAHIRADAQCVTRYSRRTCTSSWPWPGALSYGLRFIAAHIMHSGAGAAGQRGDAARAAAAALRVRPRAQLLHPRTDAAREVLRWMRPNRLSLNTQ